VVVTLQYSTLFFHFHAGFNIWVLGAHLRRRLTVSGFVFAGRKFTG
jgi:hypothetical protein